MAIQRRVAVRIRTYRRRRGKSQEVIAGLTGLNTEYFGQIERGRRTPSLPVLEMIARALEVSLTALVAHDPDEQPPPIPPLPPSDVGEVLAWVVRRPSGAIAVLPRRRVRLTSDPAHPAKGRHLSA
ncbi:helix-turn-helix domain-containing protein [Streptomonospora alba]|uniref:helix-turn-helix domain-containing protein n=1 Tax=Streptomonospora alba TaxID=183763 RepID=UPI0014705F99